MELLFSFFMILLGFGALIFSADRLVEGSSSLAHRLSVSEIAIGLTVISFGTSAPELAVNILAAFKNESEIVFGNIIGSNLMNLLLVLGASAVIKPLTIKRNTIRKEIPFSLIAILIFLILANDGFINNKPENELTRSEAVILFIFFCAFLWYVFKLPRNSSSEKFDIIELPLWKTLLFIFLGIAGLALGGHWVVKYSVNVASYFNISHKFIGLTLVAGGTSLPELVTSIVAAKKNRMDMAVGNVIGSNIFNIFFILAVSAGISHLPYDIVLNWDAGLLAFCSAILLILFWMRKKMIIDRWIGLFFLIQYILYIVYLFIRR
ncbi:calcium/sodium antiporter [candidate division KSB1 bacterium]|nr:calcium/sodium antiporter [candidate division KSB1 bacterium]